MAKDLRSFLAALQDRHPEDLVRVKRQVSRDLEAVAVVNRLERERRTPAVLFESVEGSKFPVLFNAHADRKKIALALETTEKKLLEDSVVRLNTRIPTKPVSGGPVKEVVYTGNDVDLTKLPILRHNDKDDAPYVTMAVVTSKDEATGSRDVGIFRMRLIDKETLGLYYSWGKDIQYTHLRAESKGRPLPIAATIGMHPALYLGSQSFLRSLAGEDELEAVGGMLGEPLEVVKCETSDLEVPAYGEFVIEAELLPNVRDREGPFGEFPGTYGQEVDRPVAKVKAITHRADPIWMDVAPGGLEHNLLASFIRDANLYMELKRVNPGVKAVHIPPSGTCFNAYISMEKVNEGDGKNILMVALGIEPLLKMAVVVDPDVDIYNDSDVLRAITHRVVADRDIFFVTGARACRLDPTTYNISRMDRDGMVTKIGIDATDPLWLPYTVPERIVNRLAERISLKDYIE